jgi:hypothetical protein
MREQSGENDMSMNLDQAPVVCRRGTTDTSRMVAASHILSMSSVELQALIRRELRQNPAIEMMEHEVCRRCGHILDGPRCPHCRLLQRDWDSGADARAEARAQALLHELLDRSEQMQLSRRGYLEVASRTHQGRFYRIPAHGGYVSVYENGQAVSQLCVGPVMPLPAADVILVHKLMIEADEESYLAKANHFPVSCT